jgi:hypothetical protein
MSGRILGKVQIFLKLTGPINEEEARLRFIPVAALGGAALFLGLIKLYS